ncbi:MAG TPA: MFS transporter, partial [Thermodesulfobacteriota bacterium]|nr:MFS transporter [Thermodesulfobacteriota bacterium]
WQRTYLVLALVLMTVVAPSAALLLRTRPRDLGLEPDGVPAPGENCAIEMNSRFGLSLSEGLRTRQFWAMAGVMLTIAVGIGITMQHVIAMAVDMGHAREFGALIFSIAGILAAAGRLSGFVSDRLGREAAFTIVGILFLASVFALLGFLATKEAWTLYLYAVTFGLGSGLSSPTIGAGAADLFGGRSFGKILGFANISYGVGIGVGAWAGGMIFDRMGSYRLAVLAAIPLFILMSALFWVMAPGKAKKR